MSGVLLHGERWEREKALERFMENLVLHVWAAGWPEKRGAAETSDGGHRERHLRLTQQQLRGTLTEHREVIEDAIGRQRELAVAGDRPRRS